MSKIEFEEIVRRKELSFRGAINFNSSLVELIVTRIIMVSNIANVKEEIIKLRRVMISEKIEMAQCLLKIFHPDIYKENKSIFNRFTKLKNFRNQIAHCVITWEYPEDMKFTVWDLSEDKKGKSFYRPIEMSVDECKNKLSLFSNTSRDFYQLIETLENKLGLPFIDFSYKV
jgi:hypothetical protein